MDLANVFELFLESNVIDTKDQNNEQTPDNTEASKGKKRRKNMDEWLRVKAKILRNSGKPYVSSSKDKKLVKGRELKPPCSEKCKLKCFSKFTEDERKQIFSKYWELGDLQKQRDFLVGSMSKVSPKYRYAKEGSTRQPNNSFYFEKNKTQRIRVCKSFFKNTLDINDRPIRTILDKQVQSPTVLVQEDQRGKHRKVKQLEDKIKEGMRNYISSIPIRENHYAQDLSSRQIIDGSKTVAQIYQDYVYEEHCNAELHVVKEKVNELSNEGGHVNSNTEPNKDETTDNTKPTKGRKRQKNMEEWQRVKAKILRNSGKPYVSSSKDKKPVKGRELKPPCTEKCKWKCFSKFTEEERKIIFNKYWELGDLQKQRNFIAQSMTKVAPRYRYARAGSTRRNNNSFYFKKKTQRIRVCKLFFKNTLDITDRPIRTILDKLMQSPTVLIQEDKRGKHKNHKQIENKIKEGVRKYISSIPKMENHYNQPDSTQQFIVGSKTVAQIYRDYVSGCTRNETPHANYVMFSRIFNKEFNLSFFTRKKNQCQLQSWTYL